MTDNRLHPFASDEYRAIIATTMVGFLLVDTGGVSGREGGIA